MIHECEELILRREVFDLFCARVNLAVLQAGVGELVKLRDAAQEELKRRGIENV